jgi:hypothetical protein
MATTAPDNLYLSPDQQDLLLAALTSNSSSSPLFNALSHHSLHSKSMSPTSQAYNPQGSPPAPPHTAGLDTEFPHGTPLLGAGLDYNDWDAEFDQDGPWDYDLGADLLHDTSPAPISNGEHKEAGGGGDASSTPARNGESEKRKDPPQSDGTEETDPKRRGAYFFSVLCFLSLSIIFIYLLKYTFHLHLHLHFIIHHLFLNRGRCHCRFPCARRLCGFIATLSCSIAEVI